MSLFEPMKLALDEDGTLTLTGDIVEPRCVICGEEIRWVLDMWSFAKNADRPGFSAGHARCLWTKNGFTEQRKLAPAQF